MLGRWLRDFFFFLVLYSFKVSPSQKYKPLSTSHTQRKWREFRSVCHLSRWYFQRLLLPSSQGSLLSVAAVVCSQHLSVPHTPCWPSVGVSRPLDWQGWVLVNKVWIIRCKLLSQQESHLGSPHPPYSFPKCLAEGNQSQPEAVLTPSGLFE